MASGKDINQQIDDIVVSSRVRIARNLENYRFPQLMDINEADGVVSEVLNVMKTHSDKYEFKRIKDMDDKDKYSYVEKHLISPALLEPSWRGSFLLREDEKITIMLNEEDHLRIQVLLEGFELEEGFKICSETDDFIEKKLNYAFHEKYGYLTSCPTNAGTGLRASVMLHLPALTMTNHLKIINETIQKFGLTMRGIYGEGTKGMGDLYQISNQTTMGQSEEEIITKLEKVIGQVIKNEGEMREYLNQNDKLTLEDRIYRSFGILKYSRKMSTEECMKHLSNIKLGADIGILKELSSDNIIKLMEKIQPANIQVDMGKELKEIERDIERANIIRSYL